MTGQLWSRNSADDCLIFPARRVKDCCCKAVGLKAGTASADYIHLYHGNASLLAESLEVIQQTAAVILAALEPSRTEEMADAELAQVA
jgi:hypothetical protein